MSDPSRESSPYLHHMFQQSYSSPRMNYALNFISSIWEDNRIEKLDNNQCDCLWCDIPFQGINATKALAHVLGIRIMHIKSFLTPFGKHHLSRYKELQNYKADKMTVIS